MSGKVCVITGVGSWTGKAIVETFAAKGCAVVIIERNQAGQVMGPQKFSRSIH